MNTKKICGLLLTLFMIFVAQTSSAEHELSNSKIGQMIMVGFRGTNVTPDHHIWKDIEKGNIGGIVLFDYDLESKKYGRNITSPSQLKKLCSDLQKINDSRLLIAVDQEGGKVRRLKVNSGFPALPSAAEMGGLDPEYTYKKGMQTGKILSEMGINMDFAPVADVDTNPENPVIGKLGRSFSSDPQKVIRHCRAFISGLNKFGVAGCLKHFPGHGSSRSDSHLGVTDITGTWNEKEILPYKKIKSSNMLFAVMPGHMFNAKLDPEYPASLSKKTLSILRKDLAYNGIIISDDMQMKAISKHYGLKTTILKAVNAGTDILLFGNNLDYDPDIAEKSINIIRELIKEGKINTETVNESIKRIAKFKKRLARLEKQ